MPQPTSYRWRAPTTFTDGVPIPPGHSLNYEIGEADGQGDYTPLFTVVGNLQPVSPAYYDAPVGSMIFDPGEHTLAIRAINDNVSPAVPSEWSNGDTFTVSDEIPNAPFDFSVEF